MFDKDATGRFPPFVVKEIDPELVDHSRPKYNFTNAMDVDPVEGTLVVFLSPNDASGWVRSEERWRGTFFQVMQLAAFPFDAQTLQLSLRLPRRIDYGRSFVQFHNSVGPQVEMKDWVRLAEWRRYEPTAETSTDSKGRLQCAELIWLAAWLGRDTIKIPLVRRYEYYVWSILGVIASISFLAFVSFAINADDLPGRSSLVVTLLLTMVAFKLVISDILPKVSYWTCLDYYINACFGMLLIIAVENGCVGLVANRAPHLFEQYGDLIEIATAAAVFALWAVFHLWFIGWVFIMRRRETAHLAGLHMASEAAQARYLMEKEAQRNRSASSSRLPDSQRPARSHDGYDKLKEDKHSA